MTRRLPPWSVPLAAAAAGVVVAFLGARAAMPPFLPIGDYAAYGASTAAADVVLAPVMHAPWFGAVALPLAAIVAAAVLACLCVVARRLDASPAAALVIMLAWAARPEVAAPLAHGAPVVVALGLTWLALALAVSSLPVFVRSGGAALSAAAGAIAWPPIAVLTPVVAAAAVVGHGTRAAMLVCAGAALGLGGGAAAWAARAGAIAGAPVAPGDVWSLAFAPAPPGDVPYPWPPLTAMPLPLALAVAGAAVAWQTSTRRGVWLAGAVATLGLAAAPGGWRTETARALVWGAWPLAGAGLAWIMARASAARRGLVLAALGVVLVGSGLLGAMRETALVEPRAFADSLVAVLAALDRAPTFVAEDPRIDTAVVAWGGGTVRRVPPAADRVAAVASSGALVLAGPAARSALELRGVRFAPGPGVSAPVSFAFARVAGGFHCVEVGARWSELPGLDYTGRLGAHVPAGEGQLEIVVAGPAPLAVGVTSAEGRPRGTVDDTAARDLADLPPVLWPGDGRLPVPGTHIVRALVPAVPDVDVDVGVALGARAPLVAARMHGSATATLCAAPLPRFDPLASVPARTAVAVPLDDRALLGAGWREMTSQGRLAGARASVLVPAVAARAVTIAVEASAAAATDAAPPVVRLVVNGVPVASRSLSSAPTAIDAAIPASLWVDGTNEITIEAASPGAPADAWRDSPAILVRAIRVATQ